MFNTDPNNPPDAISAVKALAKASAVGQRIYQITQANQVTILPNINHDPATMAEIRASLNVGKTVITHTDAVSIPGGWSGAGYVILDPETNVGAWKIGGGLNGGFLDNYPSGGISSGLFLISILALFQAAPLILSGYIVLLAVQLFHLAMITMISDIRLKESGCPAGLSALLASISASLALLPRLFRDAVFGMVISFYSFIMPRSIKASAQACGV